MSEKAPTESELLSQGDDKSVMEKILTAHLEQPNDTEEIETNHEQDHKTEPEVGSVENEEGTPSGEKDKEAESEVKDAEEEETERSLKQGKLHEEPDETQKEDTEPSDKKKEEDGPIDDWEKELDKFQLRKGASEKSVNALAVIKKKSKAEHRERLAAEKRAAEAEAHAKELASKAMTPEREKEFQDAINFKKFIDIENDPEFNKQHTEAIDSSRKEIMGLLNNWRLPEPMQKFILDNGGPVEFSISDQLMPPQYKNEDGSVMTQSQWWKSNIVERLREAQLADLDDAMRDYRGRVRAKNQAIQQARANRDNIIKDRTEKAEAARKEFLDRVQKHVPVVMKEIGLEDIKLKEIPPNATPEQKASIEKENENFAIAQKMAQKFVIGATPEDKVEAAIWAVYGQLVSKQEKGDLLKKIEALTGENKKLEEKLGNIKRSSKTLPKDSAPPVDSKKKVQTLSSDSAADRMAKLLDAAENQ